MRILICEDSEQNLQSAREFAEKVKGEHEVEIFELPVLAAFKIREGQYDCVLTDLYQPNRKTGANDLPGGLSVAIAALRRDIPVCIITDGHAHCDDALVCHLGVAFQSCWNDKRFQFHLVDKPDIDWKGVRQYKPGSKGETPDGKLVKDWEYCFRELMQKSASA